MLLSLASVLCPLLRLLTLALGLAFCLERASGDEIAIIVCALTLALRMHIDWMAQFDIRWPEKAVTS